MAKKEKYPIFFSVVVQICRVKHGYIFSNKYFFYQSHTCDQGDVVAFLYLFSKLFVY